MMPLDRILHDVAVQFAAARFARISGTRKYRKVAPKSTRNSPPPTRRQRGRRFLAATD
jgi:hypothetical protein